MRRRTRSVGVAVPSPYSGCAPSFMRKISWWIAPLYPCSFVPDDLVSECEALLDAVVEVGENDGFSDAALTGDGVLGGGLLLCHDGFSLSTGSL